MKIRVAWKTVTEGFRRAHEGLPPLRRVDRAKAWRRVRQWEKLVEGMRRHAYLKSLEQEWGSTTGARNNETGEPLYTPAQLKRLAELRDARYRLCQRQRIQGSLPEEKEAYLARIEAEINELLQVEVEEMRRRDKPLLDRINTTLQKLGLPPVSWGTKIPSKEG